LSKSSLRSVWNQADGASKTEYLSRGQLDGLWSYVGNKGEKKLSRDGQQRAILAVNDD